MYTAKLLLCGTVVMTAQGRTRAEAEAKLGIPAPGYRIVVERVGLAA